jgi:hypothetical protein
MELLLLLGKIIEKCISMWFIILIFVILGIWKAIDIFIYLIHHIRFV